MNAHEELLRALARAPGSLERWRDGAECPDEFQLAALAEETLGEARAADVRAHLARCGHCVLLTQAALEERAAMEAEAAPPVAERGAGAPPRRGSLRLVAPLVAAAAAVLLLLGPFGGGGDVSRHARYEAIPVVTPRGPVEDEAEAAFRRGLAAYEETDAHPRDLELAEAEFAAAAALDPSRADVSLYLGSCRLLGARPAEAVFHLQLAAAGLEDEMRAEAVWQLAQAHLALDEGEAARLLLEELAGGDSLRAGPARLQLEALDG